MRLREARQEDAEDLTRLYAQEGWPSFDRATVEKLLSSSAWLVAEEAGAAIGLARYLTDGVLTVYLCEILVAKAHRGRGIGRRLVQGIFARHPGLRMDTLSDADGFYEALGFCRRGRAYRGRSGEEQRS